MGMTTLRLHFFVMAKGRPGGNPDLQKFQFTTDKDEPCTTLLQLKVPQSLKDAIAQKPNWQDWVRKLLADNVDK